MSILIRKNNSWINPRELWVRKNDEWKPIISDQTNYEWASTDWSECTKECGGGIQERTVWCRSAVTGETLGDAVCEMVLGPKPEEIRDCNTHACVECSYTVADTSLPWENPLQPTTRVWRVGLRPYPPPACQGVHVMQLIWDGTIIYERAPDLTITELVIGNYKYTRSTFIRTYQTGQSEMCRIDHFRICREQLS